MQATLLFLFTFLFLVELEIGQRGQNIEQENFRQFQEWKSKMNKHFASQDEEAYRFRVFEANNEIIKAHNALQDKAYTMGLNKFSDLTKEEFQSIYLINLSQYALEVEAEDKDKIEQVQLEVSSLPSYYDSKPLLNTPKDEGQCQSDWAFSAISSVEAGYALKYGRPIDLSEQQLVDCAGIENGCQGGWVVPAFNYLKQNGGVAQERFYPYMNEFGQCKYYIEKAVQIDGYVKIIPNGISLQNAVIQYGSIATGADALEWQYYLSGIFIPSSIGSINHVVNIIGWGESGGYFIIRNSWGTDWGESGYIRLDAQRGGIFYQYLYAAKVA